MARLELALLLFILPATALAFTTSPRNASLVNGIIRGRVSGHEEITRQALVQARDALPSAGIQPASPAVADLFRNLDVQYGASGFQTASQVILGNYATDYPDDPDHPVQLKKYWRMPEGQDWDTWPGILANHFVRYPRPRPAMIGADIRRAPQLDEFLVTQSEICYEARGRILEVTLEAIRRWESNRREALFLLGHATHTIQDSFSPEHGRRDTGRNNSDLLNVCYYGDETRKTLERAGLGNRACYHQEIGLYNSAGDFVWIHTRRQESHTLSEWPSERVELAQGTVLSVLSLPSNRETALKHEARLARSATARYIFLIAQYLTELNAGTLRDPDRTELIHRLDRKLFEGSPGIPGIDYKLIEGGKRAHYVMPYGILRCERLQDALVPSQEPMLRDIVGKPLGELLWGAPDAHKKDPLANSIFKALGGEMLERIERERRGR